MRWKAFGIVLAAALAVPFAALADNNNPPPSTITGGGNPAGTPSTTTPRSRARANVEAFAGAVTTASSSSITVDELWSKRGSTGGSVTVAIDSGTKIVYGKGQSSIDPGDLVGVVATGTDASSLTARRVHVGCNCHIAAGTLDAISTSELRVEVARTGPFDKVLKGNEVTFQIGGAQLPSLSVGDRVAIRFSADGFFKDPSFNWQDATFTVEKLRVARDKGQTAANP